MAASPKPRTTSRNSCPLRRRRLSGLGESKRPTCAGVPWRCFPPNFASISIRALRDRPTIEAVFEHFSDSEMAELDKTLPDEFWADDALQELVQQHRKDFESVR